MKDLLAGHFHHIVLEALPGEEQALVLQQIHPSLAPLLPHMMASLAAIQHIGGGQQRQSTVATGMSGRFFGVRDMLKWSKRIVSLHGTALAQYHQQRKNANQEPAVEDFPLSLREAALIEAVDCFLALIRDEEVSLIRPRQRNCELSRLNSLLTDLHHDSWLTLLHFAAFTHAVP